MKAKPPLLTNFLPKNKQPDPTIIIAVRDARLAPLIGNKLRAWLLPGGTDIDIHVIGIEDADDDLAKIASLCAQLGFKNPDLTAAFPDIKLNWSDHDTN